MPTLPKTTFLVLIALIIPILMISCDKGTNPAPEIGYRLFLSASPDSIPNTGAATTVTAIVRDLVDSSQVGGFRITFDATIGDITGEAISSSFEPTGTFPTVYYDCNACQDTVMVVVIRGILWDSTGVQEDDDTTRVVVYVP